MLKRCWLPILVVVGLALGAAAPVSKPSQISQAPVGKSKGIPQKQGAAENQNQPQGKVDEVRAPMVVYVRAPERSKADAEEQRRDREERSQTDGRMVNLTLLIAIATVVQAVILAITIGTSIKQLRPYISGWPIHISSFDLDHFAKVKVLMQNHGVTPAYDVGTRIATNVFEYPLPKGFRAPELPSERGARFVLFKDLPFTHEFTAQRKFTADEIAGIVTGTKRIYVFGEIGYRRMRFFRHKTRFLASLQGDETALRKLTVNSADTFDVRFESERQGNCAT